MYTFFYRIGQITIKSSESVVNCSRNLQGEYECLQFTNNAKIEVYENTDTRID